MYVDDIVLLAETGDELQEQIVKRAGRLAQRKWKR